MHSASATPGSVRERISATLAHERWGEIVISHDWVWRVLRQHAVGRRINRLSLVAGYSVERRECEALTLLFDPRCCPRIEATGRASDLAAEELQRLLDRASP